VSPKRTPTLPPSAKFPSALYPLLSAFLISLLSGCGLFRPSEDRTVPAAAPLVIALPANFSTGYRKILLSFHPGSKRGANFAGRLSTRRALQPQALLSPTLGASHRSRRPDDKFCGAGYFKRKKQFHDGTALSLPRASLRNLPTRRGAGPKQSGKIADPSALISLLDPTSKAELDVRSESSLSLGWEA